MKSTVYFAPAKLGKKGKSLVQGVGELFERVEGGDVVAKRDLVAIKVSFSEVGNTAYVRPQLLRPIADRVRDRGGKPFFTDSNTLYVGGRANAVDHIETALRNGFDFAAAGAPIIVADGLTGKAYEIVRIDREQCRTAKIGAAAYHAHAILSAAHVHGHGGTGLAATFKNLGMGLGSRAGKQMMHSLKEAPKVNEKACVGCGLCARYCLSEAITLLEGKARVDVERCTRCGECTVTCPERAIAIRWGESDAAFQKRIVEYAAAVLANKKGKALFFAYLLNVSPGCLCERRSDAGIVPDVGVLASRDPVAIEQATFDLVNAQPGIPSSKVGDCPPGEDKFRKLFPEMDSTVVMRYAEEIGLGTRAYDLVEI
ncbi:MAG: DUF362 domain-containing protein [Planctomycetota bacterium]